jgi:hypothetical protein
MKAGNIILGAGLGAVGGYLASQQAKNDEEKQNAELQRKQELLLEKEKRAEQRAIAAEKRKRSMELEDKATDRTNALSDTEAKNTHSIELENIKHGHSLAEIKARGENKKGDSYTQKDLDKTKTQLRTEYQKYIKGFDAISGEPLAFDDWAAESFPDAYKRAFGEKPSKVSGSDWSKLTSRVQQRRTKQGANRSGGQSPELPMMSGH